MGVGYGDGEGVGGIGGELAGAGEEDADHGLNLRFFGVAVAGDGLFDAVGRIFGDREAVLGEGEDGAAARLAEQEGGAGVFMDESFFDRGFVWIVGFDEVGDAFGQREKSRGHRQIGGRTDAASGNERQAIAVLRDNAPAGMAQTGVDAEDKAGLIHFLSLTYSSIFKASKSTLFAIRCLCACFCSHDDRHSLLGGVMKAAGRKQHFLCLDALRGLAALMIVLCHTTAFSGRVFPEGYLAVDLFFALSGVVIPYAYDARLKGGLSLGRFMLMRYVRLWPLYILGSALLIVAVGLGFSEDGSVSAQPYGISALLAFFMLPNVTVWGGHLYPFNYVAWSLFFELAVNLAYPGFLRILKTRGMLAVMLIAAAGMGVCIAASATHSLQEAGWNFDAFMAGGLCRAVYSFCAGILLYRFFSRREEGAVITGNNASFVLLAILWILLIVLASGPGTAVRPFFDFLAAAFIMPGIVFLALYVEPVGWGARLCAFMGARSYAVYALHMPLKMLLRKFLEEGLGVSLAAHRPELEYGFLGVVLGLCWAADRFYDLPLRRFLLEKVKRVETA